MSIYRRALSSIRNLFSRSDSISDKDFWWHSILEKIGISNDKALKVSAVYACNKVLAETISTLPLKCYERTSNGEKEEYNTYFLVKVLDKPNILQTRAEYLETLVTSINLRGNNFSGKNFDKKGYLKELIPFNALQMSPKIKNNQLIYEYSRALGELSAEKQNTYMVEPLQPWQVFHTKNLTIDGVNGLTPISYAKKSIELALESENHGHAYFKNGARTSGFLKHPGQLKDTARENLKKSMEKRTTGDNKFRIIVLEEGMEWHNASLTNEDAQYLQTRQFQVEDIARWYRVPLELIQHPAKTASYASVEQFMLSFVIHTIRPWLVKLEQRINYDLVPEEDHGRVFFEFNVNGLLRGDIVSRYRAYSIGRQWGWLSVDDVRGLENMNPLPNGTGKKYLMPLNMEDVDNPRKRKGE